MLESVFIVTLSLLGTTISAFCSAYSNTGISLTATSASDSKQVTSLTSIFSLSARLITEKLLLRNLLLAMKTQLDKSSLNTEVGIFYLQYMHNCKFIVDSCAVRGVLARTCQFLMSAGNLPSACSSSLGHTHFSCSSCC